MRFLALLLALNTPLCLHAAGEEGYLEPARNIQISSPEAGVIAEVLVKEGQQVKKGDILVKLDGTVIEHEAAMAEEEAAMLQRRLTKLEELLPQRYASPDEVAATSSQLKITRLRRDRALALVERLTLRSPIDGVVTEVRFDEAESVPGANEHVATVVQLAPMQVQFNIPIAAAAKLEIGQSVEIELPEVDRIINGTIDFISPVSTAVVNTTRVKVVLPEAANDFPAGTKALLKLP